jgi:trimeric autotransporter adhesin
MTAKKLNFTYMKKILLPLFVLIVFVTNAQVGIGTTTPNGLLDIKASNAASPTTTDGLLIPRVLAFPSPVGIAQNGMLVFLTTAFSGNKVGLYYYDFPSLTWKWIATGNNGNVWAFNNANSRIDLPFQSDGTTARPVGNEAVILDNGNVGFGTLNPARHFQVNRDIDNGTKFSVSNPNAGINAFSQITAETIGATSYLYSINNGYPFNASYPWFTASNSLLQGTGVGGLSLGATNPLGFMNFFTGGKDESMRITKDGNVGIGTKNPLSPVHISGSSASILLERFGNGSHFVGRSANGTQAIPTVLNANDIATRLSGWGYNGSNYLPVGIVDIMSEETQTPTTAGGYIKLSTTIAGGTSTTEKMRITSTGNVGIGTSAPTAKLDVVGTEHITSPDGTSSYSENFVLRRTLAQAVGSYVEIGTFSTLNSGGNNRNLNIEISIIDSHSGGGASSKYLITANYDDVAGQGWKEVMPISTSGARGGSYVIDIGGSLITGSVDFAILRLRTNSALVSATIPVTLEIKAINNPFAPLLGTGTDLTAMALFRQTPLTINQGRVGVGLANPSEKLDLAGNFKLSGALMPNNLPGTSGQVLTSAGAGVAPTWNSASSVTTNEWHTTGNGSTVDGTNFIGTTDNIPFNFRVNNSKSGRISATGETFFGFEAGKNNPNTGNSTTNTAFGYRAFFANNNVISRDNAAFGKDALNGLSNGGSYNSAFGSGALNANSSASYNTAVGKDALTANTANYNTALGWEALITNTTGVRNIGIGIRPLRYYQTVNDNIAIGYESMVGNATIASNTGTNNTAIGNFSLNANSSGTENVTLGNDALRANTSGSQNTAIGYQALLANTTGTENTSIGRKSMPTNTSGSANTAVGFNALFLNNGNNNTGIGRNALFFNSTGSNNAALGWNSMFTNKTGASNTALGYGSLYTNDNGNQNVAVGEGALYLNVTGSGNVANGYNSLYNNLASSNSAIGNQAMYRNTIGTFNIAFGTNTLYTNTSGDFNVAIGNNTMNLNLTGSSNTAVGYSALTTNSVGINNTAIGRTALNSNTASNNTAVGHTAMFKNTTGTGNVAVGYQSLYENLSGSNNTGVGNGVLQFNTGSNNTALGKDALNGNTNGVQNVAVGRSALLTNSTGYSNVAIGFNSLTLNTNGSENTAIGANSSAANTTGFFNVAAGTNALLSNTSGSANTAIGHNSMNDNTTGLYNSAVGESALKANTTGSSNSGFGVNAMLKNTTGYSNVAFGVNSMLENIDGYQNSSFGTDALRKNTSGYYNTANGGGSLTNNTTGFYNTALGISTLGLNTTGNYNVALGGNALNVNTTGASNTSVGSLSLLNTTTGSNNTAFGSYALQNNTTGSNNIGIGTNANVPNPTANDQMSIGNVIYGTTMSTTASGRIGIGVTNPGTRLQIGPNHTIPNVGGLVQINLNDADSQNQGLKVSVNKTTGTNYGVNGTAFGTGANTNIGLYGYAAGANAKNWGLYLEEGDSYMKGTVGIGTFIPSEKLDVVGNVKFSGALMPNNIAGTTGQVLVSSGAGVAPTWDSNPVKPIFKTTATGIYNVTNANYTVRVNVGTATGINLPAAATNTGKIFVIIGIDGLATIPFTTSGGLINDEALGFSITTLNGNDRYTIQSDGTDWVVIGR